MSADEDFVDETRYGFRWGPFTVERCASIERHKGEGLFRILKCYVGGDREPGGPGEKRREVLEIYVSPTGRSVRVFRDGEELR